MGASLAQLATVLLLVYFAFSVVSFLRHSEHAGDELVHRNQLVDKSFPDGEYIFPKVHVSMPTSVLAQSADQPVAASFVQQEPLPPAQNALAEGQDTFDAARLRGGGGNAVPPAPPLHGKEHRPIRLGRSPNTRFRAFQPNITFVMDTPALVAAVVTPFPAMRGADDSAAGDEVSHARRAAVREAMSHAWDAYVQYAWGQDELRVHQKVGVNTFGGIGATVFDSADTLLIMGLHEEAAAAADFMANASFARMQTAVSVFETNIRIIGGSLAYFELSGDTRILAKAVEVADTVAGAFATASGLPYGARGLLTGEFEELGWAGGAVLADAGTTQCEWWKLTQHTGNHTYNATAQRPLDIFRQYTAYANHSLLPLTWSLSGVPIDHRVSMGGMGDSYYEYLLKYWLLTGKAHDTSRQAWVGAMDEMLSTLVKVHNASGLTYIGKAAFLGGVVTAVEPAMEHLTCFAGGMLALGVLHGAVDGEKAARYLDVAKRVTYTCYQMYAMHESGLSGDTTLYPEASAPFATNQQWQMRPEAVESLFVLFRVTGQAKYRDWGWKVFESIQKYTRVADGYRPVEDVRYVQPLAANRSEQALGPRDYDNDIQASFFLAETLKYLFLLFSPPSYMRLDQWVFNTEAHPLRISSANGAWGTPLPPVQAI